jgi:hypothetical protein
MSIIPEKNGVPLIAWSEFMHRLPTDEEQERWAIEYPDAGAGLVCGEVSGIIGLDIDSDEEEAFIMRFIPDAGALRAKRGSKGRTIFFKYNGESSRSWKKDGKVVCELLSNKRKTTIPPSIHRSTGKPYEWINETAELTELPASVLNGLDALYPAPKREVVTYPVNNEYDKTELHEAEQMLSYISPDCSRDEWLAIGMGLRDEFGDAAYSIWDKWSQGSAKYKQREMQAVWRSFNNSGYTIATVVYLAQQAGWKRAAQTPVIQTKEVDLKKADINQRLELTAHGLVGDIADWIVATAYRPQPQLALGAALTFVGMLKGHKYSSSTGLRTNLLTLNIAPTASGKEHPQNCLWHLIKACGLDKHLMAEPCSGTALLKGILNADRVGLLCVDEMDRFVGNIANKNSGGFQREIIDYIIKSFSKANSFLVGRQYADDKKNPRIDIVNPHLCVLGSTVKERFSQSCTSEDAIDGFLNRWVLFESTERPARQYKKISIGNPPQKILDAVQAIIAAAPPPVFHNQEEPLTHSIKLTPDAYALMEQYSDTIEELLKRSEYPLDALYSRSCEHVAKLALILCDNEFVRERDMKLAIEIVTESNKLIATFAGLIADNEHQKLHIKVLELIKKYGEISNARFIRATKYLTPKLRGEIVNDLLASGEVVKVEVGQTFNLKFNQ